MTKRTRQELELVWEVDHLCRPGAPKLCSRAVIKETEKLVYLEKRQASEAWTVLRAWGYRIQLHKGNDAVHRTQEDALEAYMRKCIARLTYLRADLREWKNNQNWTRMQMRDRGME